MEDKVFAVAGVIAAVLFVGIVVQEVMTNRERREMLEAQPGLEVRLANLGALMRSSAQVLEEVQAEIQARVALAEKAQLDADQAQQLAELNEAERLAVTRLLRAELASEFSRNSRRSFWQGLALNAVFFLAGVLATYLTGRWFGA